MATVTERHRAFDAIADKIWPAIHRRDIPEVQRLMAQLREFTSQQDANVSPHN